MDIDTFSQIIFDPVSFSLSMMTKDYNKNLYIQLLEYNTIAPFIMSRQNNQSHVENIVRNTSWNLWRTLIDADVEYAGILITAKGTHMYSAIITHKGTNTNSARYSNALLHIHSHPCKVNGKLNRLSYTPSMKDYSAANNGIYLVATKLGIIIYGTYDRYDTDDLKKFLISNKKGEVPRGIIYTLYAWDALIHN